MNHNRLVYVMGFMAFMWIFLTTHQGVFPKTIVFYLMDQDNFGQKWPEAQYVVVGLESPTLLEIPSNVPVVLTAGCKLPDGTKFINISTYRTCESSTTLYKWLRKRGTANLYRIDQTQLPIQMNGWDFDIFAREGDVSGIFLWRVQLPGKLQGTPADMHTY